MFVYIILKEEEEDGAEKKRAWQKGNKRKSKIKDTYVSFDCSCFVVFVFATL